MNSLLIRLWVALWLTIILVVVLSVEVFDFVRAQRTQQITGPPEQVLSELSIQVVEAVADGESLEGWLRSVSNRHRQVFLLDIDGKDLRGRQVPEYLLRAHRLFQFRQQARPFRRIRSRLLRELPEFDGLTLAVARPDPRAQFRWLTLEVLIALGFIVSGIVAVVLAGYLTRPIRKLRAATDRVALGDFESHVAADMRGRRDEIGQLAVRFDEMTAQLSESRDQQQGLLRDISHELRSPLARLLLTADLLPVAKGDELVALQARFRRDIDHLDAMIEEVLTLSRFDTQGPGLELARVSVLELLQPVMEDAQFEANALDKEVALVAQPDAPVFVSADIAQLRRAVENVLRNGVRHAPVGTAVNVRVTSKHAEGRELVEITVADQGAGVKPTDLERIFTPFFRSPEQRAQSAGYGIGLALVKRIIEAHQGRVSAANLPAQGFEVSIELPAATSSEQGA